MIPIDFTPEQIGAPHHQRFHHPHPRVQPKMGAVYLKSQGLPHHEIRRPARIPENTLRGYLRQFQEGGVARLKRIDWEGAESELDGHRATLEESFRSHPPRSAARAAAAIERIAGLRRGPTQVRKSLKSPGLSYRKPGLIPARADADEQAQCLDEEWWPRPRQAQRLRRAVGSGDAAHFVHGAFPGSSWCFVRPLVRGPSGRERFNVPGAIDAVTHELTTAVNDTVIGAMAARDRLRARSARYAGPPLTLALDNARHRKCEVVRPLAAELRIELLYLPPYSPNPNRIERLWRFAKEEVLTRRYHEDFTRFKAAIVECPEGIAGRHKEAIASSLTLNFQTFEDPQLLTA